MEYEGIGLVAVYGWMVGGLVVARWAWSPPGGSLGALVGAGLGLANFFIEGGRTLSLGALAAYPAAVVGAMVGATAQLLWRKALPGSSQQRSRAFLRVPRQAKWSAAVLGFAGLVVGMGWIYRPYSLGWIEMLGAAVNSLPYGFFFGFVGGAVGGLASTVGRARAHLR